MTDGNGARRLVLVTGVGRSGTSAFTGSLSELGFHVPQPQVEADDTNPRGFNEPRWVVDFHTRLLRRSLVTTTDSRPSAWETMAKHADREAVVGEARSWLDVQFVGVDRVVIKDPRLPWFLPLWRRCAEELGVTPAFVTMLRPPTEVLGSARQWYGTWQVDASRAAGWANVMLRTELQTRNDRRVFVRYDELLADWRKELARVAERLELSGLLEATPDAHERIDAFIDPTLRRQSPGWETLSVPPAVRDLVDRCWAVLLRLADDRADHAEAIAALDDLRADYERFHADVEAMAQSTIRAARRKRKTTTPPSKAKQPTVKEQPRLPARGFVRRALRRTRRVARRIVRRGHS